MGDDTIVGGAGEGDDYYSGGSGTDFISYNSAINPLLINLGDGTASGIDIGNDTLVNIERLSAGQGNDVIYGHLSNNDIDGYLGDDIIVTFDGDDIIKGGQGNDNITSGKGNDVITTNLGNDIVDAGSGNDRIISDLGSDQLTGGLGSDIFEIDLTTSRSSDLIKILDFENQDKIVIKNNEYNHSANLLDDINLSYNVITNKTLISNSELDKLSDFNIELEGNYEVSTLLNIDQTNLEIKLNNLNSNNTVLSDITIGVTKPEDVNNSSNIVLEGLSKGSQVGLTANAQDADSDVSYSLTDSSGGSFKIDSTTGVVTTDAVLDYETLSSHTPVEALSTIYKNL